MKSVPTYMSIIFVMFFTTTAHTQSSTIAGLVKYRVQEPFWKPAYISIVNQNWGTQADSSGNFMIKNVPAGIYRLKISVEGYHDTILKPFYLMPDSTIYFQIENLRSCKYYNFCSICPICHKKDKVVPVLYGYPSKEALRKVKKRKLVLGGCMMSDCDPHWYCKRDQEYF